MKRVVLYRVEKQQRGDVIEKRRMMIDSVTVEDDCARAAVADFTETADRCNLDLKRIGLWDYYEVLVLEPDGTEAKDE